jgi:hypothetical protein
MLLGDQPERARARLGEVAELYRRSWEAAPPRSFGRLIGMLKAAVLAGQGEGAAAYVRGAIGAAGDSPSASYALALAALVEGDDELAARAAAAMRSGSEAFDRTAEAIVALAGGDGGRYEAALGAILADFEAREEHLTGVPIADTALVLERLAARRGLATAPRSPLMPAG